MLSVICRRSTFTLQKVLHWVGPPQRCWTSHLTRASDRGSVSSCWASSTRLPSTERDTGPPAVLGLRRAQLFHRIQTHDALLLMRNQHFHSSAARLKKRVKPESPLKDLGLLRHDMKDFWKSPKPALPLLFAGMSPLICLPLYMAMTENYYPELAYAQVAYVASILSFSGGARWGFALPESSPAKPDWINLGNSVVPSLLAWMAMLFTAEFETAAIMLILGLGVSLHYDLSLLPTYPRWFKAHRATLSVMACISLVATLCLHGEISENKFF